MRAPAAFALALLASIAASAEPLAREDVPAPLRPWVDWALHGHDAETCPLLSGSGERTCVWPGRLALALDASGGRFEQEVFVAAESDVLLPGGAGAWPEDVRADGATLAVIDRGAPAVRLARGTHRITGRFTWNALPPGIAVPIETGIVDLTLNGARVARPRRGESGSLWLRDTVAAPSEGPAENRVDVEVYRLLEDAVPVLLTSQIALRVSGEAREEVLGVALPPGMQPTALASPLPARIDPDGRLRVQVRPGEWRLRIEARQEKRSESFSPPPQQESARWDGIEIWSVSLAPELRLVELEGAPAVDPTQTELPGEWRALPAFRMEPGTALTFVEKRRGNEGSASDQLALERTWHLDFDGGGATVVDQLSGSLRSALRLEMADGTVLGRAAIGGVDQPITKRASGDRSGVEVALGALSLEADSRVEGGARRLPAVGWAHDVDSLSATLMIPPGYRLLHATGVDEAHATWISRWDLLSVFFVLLIGVAVWRLFGAGAAALALATLALAWPEHGAPKLVWLALAVGEALRRVGARGRIERAISLAHVAVGVALVVITIPFAIAHVRAGIFPALERPWARAAHKMQTVSFVSEEQDAAAGFASDSPHLVAPAEDEAVRDGLSGIPGRIERRAISLSTPRSSAPYSSYSKSNFAPDPAATVQTGPGRPDWTWEAISLEWSGPVARDQMLGLWLAPPWLNGLLSIVRVLLIAALARVFFLAWRTPGGRAPALRTSASATGALAVLALLAAPARADDIPTPELLDTLRTRLLEAPSCAPSCATLARLSLGIANDQLDLNLTLDAAADVGVPLPGGGTGEGAWQASAVLVNGDAASALRRDASGVLWLRVPRGRHEVRLAGALPQRASVELALPLAPRRVALASAPSGWEVVGIAQDGSASGALQLVREARESSEAEASAARIEATAIPAFVRITRSLELGLSWRSRTWVQRIAPADGPIVVEVPLLAGESVTTPGVRVENGRALVTIPAGLADFAYDATLAIADRIALEAPENTPYTEEWLVAAGPLWHVESEGIPPVDELREGERARAWRPWPGEQLALEIERPAGVPAATLTLDRSRLTLTPGLRATDAALELSLRSSQGGQHVVTLPEGAKLTSLTIDRIAQPLRQEERRVSLTITPGAHDVAFGWREERGMSALFRSSAIDLAASSVNAHVEVAVPLNRWVLFAGGPRLGPSVMFWSALAVVACIALLLGRVSFTPLRTHDWLLLGAGLTQAPLAASLVVGGWFLAIGLRGAHAERYRAGLPSSLFTLSQLLLVAMTVLAAGVLVYAIQNGLLGTPEMRIAGNGSDAFALRWYQDRSAAELPQPWVLSLSIWWYRAAMLAWSMWLALSLVGWARWAFEQWSASGMFTPAGERETG